jgi:hypothetical protein
MEIKKVRGVFLRYVLAEVCGYFNRGRGVKYLMPILGIR